MLPQSSQVEEPPAEQDIALEEEKEIRRLVRLLGTKKSSYSREEIAKALFGEGYSERIVLGVLEKLYRK